MNELTNIDQETRMSSREIAELTAKRHADVCRDIRRQLEQQEIAERTFASSYIGKDGAKTKEYFLNHGQTMILLTGYSIPLRAKVIKRWQELEESKAPKTYIESLKALVASEEAKEAALLENETLQIMLDESNEWYSVKKIQGMGHFPGADPRNLWRPVKAWSIENEYETKRIPDPNYEHGVLCYHKDAWEGAYGIRLGQD